MNYSALPESPRWQISTEHYEDAEENLKKLVKRQKEYDDSHVKAILEESIKAAKGTEMVRPSVTTVLKQYPLLTLVLCFCQ